jgi:hypothetical protein
VLSGDARILGEYAETGQIKKIPGLLFWIQEAEDESAERSTRLFVTLAGLSNMLAEKAFVFSALRWLRKHCVHLMPCITKTRLRLLLGWRGVVKAVRVVERHTVVLSAMLV